MSSHDDELNRLLDSLAHGKPGEVFDLDSDSIAAASRFMNAAEPSGPPASFVSNLEESLMERASMRPVAISGRIEHIGEGIGLVAALPQTRRIHFGRLAAIAAAVLLLLTAGGFYRSDSNDGGGGNWLFAPVASASPAPSGSCPSRDDFYNDMLARAQASPNPAIMNPAIFRDVPDAPGTKMPVYPSSLLPSGPNASNDVLEQVEAQYDSDVNCLTVGYRSYEFVTSTQLEDGRVGLMVHFEFPGWGGNWYYVYEPVDGGWGLTKASWVMTDKELTATSAAPQLTETTITVWAVTSDIDQSSRFGSAEIRIPAGTTTTLAVVNTGYIAEELSIPDAGIDLQLAPGQSTTIDVSLTAGVHGMTIHGDGDTYSPATGIIIAGSESGGTPTALTCQQTDIGSDGLDTIDRRQTVFISSSLVRSAPNDPTQQITVRAENDLPSGSAVDSPTTAAIESAVQNMATCAAVGQPATVPTFFDLLANRMAADSGSPTPTPTSIPTQEMLTAQSVDVPGIVSMTQIDEKTVGVLLDRDPIGAGLLSYQLFVLYQGSWIPTDAVLVAPESWIFSTMPGDPVSEFGGLLWDNKINYGYQEQGDLPVEVKIAANTPTSVTLRNLVTVPRTFTIQGTNVSVTLQPGEQQTISVNLPAGSYRMAVIENGKVNPPFRGFLSVVETTSGTPVASGPQSVRLDLSPWPADCPSAEDYEATAAANGLSNFAGIQVPVIFGDGAPLPSDGLPQTDVQLQPAPNDPNTHIQVMALADLPAGQTADLSVWSDVAALIPNDLYCIATGESTDWPAGLEISQVNILPNGNVGVLLNKDPFGYGAQFYMEYAHTSEQLLLRTMMFVLTDAQFTPPSGLPIETNVLVQGWNSDDQATQAIGGLPEALHFPANTDVTITVANLGAETLTFTIPGADVNTQLAVGESKVIVVNLGAGVYRYNFLSQTSNPDLFSRLLFVSSEPPTASPVVESVSDCANEETWYATAEANGITDDYAQVLPLAFSQPAPNDPSTQLPVILGSDLPTGESADSNSQDELMKQVSRDLVCLGSHNDTPAAFHYEIKSMTVLQDGRVGVLLGSDPMGYGTQFYMIYIPGNKQWLLYQISFVIYNSQIVAPADLPLQTTVELQAWSVESSDSSTTNSWPARVQIPAGTNVSFHLKNEGAQPIVFTITGTETRVELAPGETREITVDLSVGAYRFGFSTTANPDEPARGILFASAPAAPVATPAS